MLKRGTFLGAAGAAVLTGCGGGGHGLSGLLAGAVKGTAPSSGPLRLIPEIPDPIPQGVLNNAIVGEAYRYAGATAPPGWEFLQGQALEMSRYSQLFAVLGHPQGDKSTTTFTLPKVPYPVIVATTGTLATSPRSLSSMNRDFSTAKSLGPGARPARMQPVKPVPAQLMQARELVAMQPRFRSMSPEPPSADVSARIDAANDDARSAALGALAPGNRAFLEAAIAATVSGSVSLHSAVQQLAKRLSTSEARRLLELSDRLQSGLSGNAPPNHVDPQDEAARFLLSVTITQEQAENIA